MAKLQGSIAFTGLLGGVSAYKMKNSDKIIVRMPGGPTKRQIQQAPSCINIRRNNSEFSGRSKASSQIRTALSGVRYLADHNFLPKLNQLHAGIQQWDTTSAKGERSILLSQHRYALRGFNLNLEHPFDSIVRHPLACTIDSTTGTAHVVLPPLTAGINLFLPWPATRFRLIVGIGVVNDTLFTTTGYTGFDIPDVQSSHVSTSWLPVDGLYAGETLTLAVDHPELLQASSTLVVSAGVETELLSGYNSAAYKLAGAAKILDAG